MGFIRTIVKLAAVGVAANMVLKARREGAANRASGLAGSPGSTGSTGPGMVYGRTGTLDGGASGTSGELGGGSGLGAALDSPNAAERRRTQGLGASSGSSSGDDDRPFGSSAQEGSTVRTPTLADYSRGA